MKKFNTLLGICALAVASLTISCDKQTSTGAFIGDGHTSAVIADALVNDQLTDIKVWLGDQLLAQDINYKDVTEALNIKTGTLLLTITALDEATGKDLEVYSEYVNINDETLYMILITLDDDGLNVDVDLLDYTADDFQIDGDLVAELNLQEEILDLYSLNVVNYNVAYQNKELTVDLGVYAAGTIHNEELLLLGYGADSKTLLNKDGLLSTLDLIVFGEEFTEVIDGNRTGKLLLTAVLEDLDLDLDLVGEGDLLNLVLFGDEDNFDFLVLNLSDLKIDLTSLNIQL